MNMQALLKQAQNMQKDMLKEQEKINNQIFEGKNGFVTVKVNGKKEILSVSIDSDGLDSDDIDALQDMIMVAINTEFKKIDDLTNEKMGKFANIPGLF